MLSLWDYNIELDALMTSYLKNSLKMLGVTDNRELLEVLLQAIFTLFMQDSRCITFVTENQLNPIITNTCLTFINANFATNLTHQILQVSEMGCSDYVIQISEPEKFMTTYDEANHLGIVRKGDRKMIFLPPHQDDGETLLGILKLTETKFVANILLVVPSAVKDNTEKCVSYDMMTHKYVGPTESISEPLYLDRWDSCTQQFELNANLFPHDISNLHGKIVTVACFTYEPYVILDLDKNEYPTGRDGTEMRIIDEFCKWVNCTVELVRDDLNEWGEIFENGTGNGVLGNTAEDRADIGITALYSWYETWNFLDFSAPCVRSGITCIAPAPRLIASWELPLLAFSWVMWITVFFTFVFSSFALWIAQRSLDKVLLTTFGMLVTQSQNDSRRNWRVRSITGWLLIAGLVLDNAYGGGLAATFTVPKYEKSTDTVQDIVDSNMPWGATHDAWVFSIVMSTEPKMMQLVRQFRTYEAEVLKQKSFTRTMAFSVEKLPAGHFAIGEYITKEAAVAMELMLEDIYFEYTVVMARKSSAYIGRVTQLVGRLHEAGLMQAWETQVALKHLDYEVQLEVKLSRSRRDAHIVPLGLHHVVGIFIVYITGVVMSAALLIAEIVAHRRRKRRNAAVLQRTLVFPSWRNELQSVD